MLTSKIGSGRYSPIPSSISSNSQNRFFCFLTTILICLIMILIYTIQHFDTIFITIPSSSTSVSSLSLSTSPSSTLSLSSTSVITSPPRPYIVDLTPPLSRNTLGGATWSFLHQLAALYPNSPSLEHQKHALNLINSLTELYPCRFCRKHFKEYTELHRFELETHGIKSRTELSIWLCKAHNEVNKQNNKKQIQCERTIENEMSELELMWPPLLSQSDPNSTEDCDCAGEETTAKAPEVDDVKSPSAS